MKWKYKLNLKDFLDESQELKIIVEKFNKVLEAFHAQQPHIVRCQGWKKYSELALRENDVAVFDIGMDKLYDWADQNRIWIQ